MTMPAAGAAAGPGSGCATAGSRRISVSAAGVRAVRTRRRLPSGTSRPGSSIRSIPAGAPSDRRSSSLPAGSRPVTTAITDRSVPGVAAGEGASVAIAGWGDGGPGSGGGARCPAVDGGESRGTTDGAAAHRPAAGDGGPPEAPGCADVMRSEATGVSTLPAAGAGSRRTARRPAGRSPRSRVASKGGRCVPGTCRGEGAVAGSVDPAVGLAGDRSPGGTGSGRNETSISTGRPSTATSLAGTRPAASLGEPRGSSRTMRLRPGVAERRSPASASPSAASRKRPFGAATRRPWSLAPRIFSSSRPPADSLASVAGVARPWSNPSSPARVCPGTAIAERGFIGSTTSSRHATRKSLTEA